MIGAVPHLFQRFVPKRADCRVTIVDERVFVCRLNSGAHPRYAIDVRRGLGDPLLRHDIVQLCDETQAKLIQLVHSLGLHFGAIDLVEDDSGDLWFLEINPNGQWAWIEERTGAPISEAIADSLVGNSL
jgi:glutathione synthase/RimK-type ligase-like ATP-grasp enzyme